MTVKANIVRQRLFKVAGYLLDYGPIVATVLIATIAATLATQYGDQTALLVQWVLLILVLLSTKQLVDRFRILRSVDQKIDTLLESSTTHTGIDDLFLDHKPSLLSRLQQARTIVHNGITLVGT